MQTEFNDAKLNFYTFLRKDKLVQSLGAEMKIRELTQKIILYNNHLDRAENVYEIMRLSQGEDQIKKRDKPSGGLKIYLQDGSVVELGKDEMCKDRALDFADVRSIAYCVGTYQDKRNLIQRVFIKENPLKERLGDCRLDYNRFKKTGVLESECIGEDLIDEWGLERRVDANHLSKHPTLGITRCCDYLNRSASLIRMANSGGVIKNYYSDEHIDFLSKELNGGSDPVTILSMREKKLTSKEIDQIAGYFRYQAEIDGVISKMLYTHFLRLRGETDLEGKAEEFYREYMVMGQGVNTT